MLLRVIFLGSRKEFGENNCQHLSIHIDDALRVSPGREMPDVIHVSNPLSVNPHMDAKEERLVSCYFSFFDVEASRARLILVMKSIITVPDPLTNL